MVMRLLREQEIGGSNPPILTISVLVGVNTKDIGDRSEAMVLATLLKLGKVVLTPHGDNRRYDLVVDDDGKFVRIQVKTGRLKNGAVVAPTASTYAHRGGQRRGYIGQADLFAIYCPETDQVYLVPVADAPSAEIALRVDAPLRNLAGVRWAKDFIAK